MCGIAGVLDLSRATACADLEGTATRMADALRHRGPDDAGVWVDAAAGIALGHRRLCIIDPSPAGHQPMASACGRYVANYNGELYNFRALRCELEALPAGAAPAFRGHCDTEVLLAAVASWGLDAALARFNGMYAFALWDRQERRLHLVRDRLGEKPLYYGWMGHTFLFGSELEALRAHPAFQTEVDRDALALYLRYGYVPAPRSIYRGIHKLPPGARLTVVADDLGATPAPAAYWTVRDAAERGAADPFVGSDQDAADALDALLRDAVALRLEADVPLGALLSGGVDSSTVVALMQAQTARPVRTFTIGFPEARYDEAAHARAVARHLGTEHTELYVSPDAALAAIPRLPTLYDEPFADPSQIPTYLVASLARQHVTVSLSGDGGDELFAGYDRYRWARRLWQQVGALPVALRRAAAAALTLPSPGAWDATFRLARPVVPARARFESPGDRLHKLAALLPADRPEALYDGLVSHWTDPAAVVLGAREPATAFTDRRQWARRRGFTERMTYLDMVTYLPDDILVKLDRASMGVSLEARVPLLDHRVVELAWRLPLALKLRDGRDKWLLRQVLYRYVPPRLVDRPKMGFAVPLDTWLRGPLRDWAAALLDPRRLRAEGFFDPRPIRRRWAEHQAGTRRWHYHLWDVLMFQAWLEQQEPRVG